MAFFYVNYQSVGLKFFLLICLVTNFFILINFFIEAMVCKGRDEVSEEGDDSEDLDYVFSDEQDSEGYESLELVLSQDLSMEEDEGGVQSNLQIGVYPLNDVVSDYENSDDEIEIPVVVHDKTDFRKFEWCVGIVFGNVIEFRQAVIKYVVAPNTMILYMLTVFVRTLNQIDGCGAIVYGYYTCILCKIYRFLHFFKVDKECQKDIWDTLLW